MRFNLRFPVLAAMALSVIAWANSSRAALITLPVQGWGVHNGSSTVTDGGTDAPTFTAGDNITVMGTFPEVELTNDGDYLTFSTTLTLGSRTGATGVNTLNTQLRVGLFDGPAGAVVASDTPNVGFIIEYTNQPAGGLIREQTSLIQANPFTSPTNIGNGSADSDSISGVTPPPVFFELTLTRNGGEIDLTGTISGGSHSASYSVTGHSSANFPLDGTFSFNRVGLFLGDSVNAASAALANAKIVTNVPEPASCLIAAVAVIGGALIGRRSSRLHRS